MSEDKLTRVLKEKLGILAKPVLQGFQRRFGSLAASSSACDEIAEKLETVADKGEVMALLNRCANEMSEKDSDIQLPDDRLHQYLQPILGTACTIAAVRRLEELNPELKGNEALRGRFIEEIEKVPDEDKNIMVVMALKISKIREVLVARGEQGEFFDSYKDFESITTRLLKNFYNVAKYADSLLYDKSLKNDEVLEILEGPLGAARTIVLNDKIDKQETSVSEADKEIDVLVSSSAGGINKFPMVVGYIAEKSGQAAEIVFDNREYRHFSAWVKERTIQSAKQQVLSGVNNIGVLAATKKGKAND